MTRHCSDSYIECGDKLEHGVGREEERILSRKSRFGEPKA